MPENAVNSPEHYTKGGLEVIDILASKLTEEQFEGFLVGNALKYLFRFPHKGNSAEDLKKARWYLDRLIEHAAELAQAAKP